MYNRNKNRVKVGLWIGSAALVLLGLYAIGRKRKAKVTIPEPAHEVEPSHSAIRLLHHARRAAEKELHWKNLN